MGKAIGGVPEPPALSRAERGEAERDGPRVSAAGDPRGGDGAAARAPAAPAAQPSLGPSDGASGDGSEPGIGAYMARQRRLRGLGLDELATLTRIPRRSLERLEAGAFDGPPDGFARGFVRTVAEAIGLDPADTVSRMLREPEAPPRVGLAELRRPLVLLAVLACGLLLVGLVARLGAGLGAGEGGAAPEEVVAPPAGDLPVRHDPVRALAVEEGLLAPDAGAAGPR